MVERPSCFRQPIPEPGEAADTRGFVRRLRNHEPVFGVTACHCELKPGRPLAGRPGQNPLRNEAGMFARPAGLPETAAVIAVSAKDLERYHDTPTPLSAVSTSMRAFMKIGWARLKKFGEVFITASWMSRNCSMLPLPPMRTV